MRTVSFQQMRIVAAVADTGRVRAAAQRLGLTAPAITFQVKKLETECGLPLFERARDRMRPTAAGLHVVLTARRIEAELAVCRQTLETLAGIGGGRVSIGVVSTAKYFVPTMLAAFRERHPDVELRLFVGNREEVVRGLAALDFDLTVMGQPPAEVVTVETIIGDNPLVMIAAPNHPLARRRGLPLAALAGEAFLTRETGSGTRLTMEKVFADENVRPALGMEMSSNETIKQAVMAGLGIAFISAHTIAAELESGRLVMLDINGLPAQRQWRLVRHAEKRLLPAALRFWNFIEAEGARFLPNPRGRRRGPVYRRPNSRSMSASFSST